MLLSFDGVDISRTLCYTPLRRNVFIASATSSQGYATFFHRRDGCVLPFCYCEVRSEGEVDDRNVSGYQGASFVLQKGGVMLVGHPRFGFPSRGDEIATGCP